jgi:peroxiredoxin family protein
MAAPADNKGLAPKLARGRPTAPPSNLDLPGVSSVMTHYMAHKMGTLDIPSIPEFIEMIADTGAGLYGCKASVDLFGLTKDDFIDQVKDIITARHMC